jgi:VanZ family protein
MNTFFEKLKRNHFWWYEGPMILWAIALFTQSSIPGADIPDVWVLSYDKAIHAIIYMVFAWTVHRGVVHQTRFPFLARHHYLVTFVIVALYGATDEFHQSFVPQRSSSLYDWFADCAGTLVFLSFVWLRSKWKPAPVSVTRS